MEVYVARQPIFDRDNNVFGYELLYRKNENNKFDESITHNVATSLLLMNSYYTFGINKLASNKKVFINFDKNSIDSEIPMLLEKETVVVEILEDIIPDRLFVDKIKSLKEAGYTIAIDDYIEGYEFEEIVQLSDIIKVDFFGNTKAQIISIAEKWLQTDKILLAEKVETQEVFEWAKEMGYELFQGYYFSKPKMVKGKGITDTQIQYIKIMEEIGSLEPSYSKIASIIETDIVLTYKLLKLVNANFTLSREIKSIQHGLSFLGIKAFEKWISLAMVQDLARNKPAEILKVSMTRGKFLELIAPNSNMKDNANELMMLGILSVVDVLTDLPMKEVLDDLPLSADVKNALLLQEGIYTDLYKLILCFEKGNYMKALEIYGILDIVGNILAPSYYDAVEWAEKMFCIMNEVD